MGPRSRPKRDRLHVQPVRELPRWEALPGLGRVRAAGGHQRHWWLLPLAFGQPQPLPAGAAELGRGAPHPLPRRPLESGPLALRAHQRFTCLLPPARRHNLETRSRRAGPTEGGWMHQQLVAQANGFGGHEYPFSNSNPMMHKQNRYYPFANYS